MWVRSRLEGGVNFRGHPGRPASASSTAATIARSRASGELAHSCASDLVLVIYAAFMALTRSGLNPDQCSFLAITTGA